MDGVYVAGSLPGIHSPKMRWRYPIISILVRTCPWHACQRAHITSQSTYAHVSKR